MNPLMRCYRGGAGGGGSAVGSGPVGTDILFSSLGKLAGQTYTVPLGEVHILDVNTPNLGHVTVTGTLKTDGLTRTLNCASVEVTSTGVFQFGTESVPLTTLTTINLTGAYVPLTGSGTDVTNDGVSRGIMVHPGGTLDLHGTPPTTLWTTLADHYISGTALTLATAPGWAQNDSIIVANTDFPSAWPSLSGFQTELRTLTSATSGPTANISSAIARGAGDAVGAIARWGKLQYPIDTPVSGSGMSLTQGTFSVKKAHADVPIVLDQRARVANLTRNIVITCPADPDWSVKGHGVHIMWHAHGTTTLPLVRIEGVQIRRGGQKGAIGRYPFHAHMLSYNEDTGALTADATTSYVKKCVVWDSVNRAYTIHGTCGMVWHDNIAYDIDGHAFFLEDGSEQRNDIRRNSVFRVRAPEGSSEGINFAEYKGVLIGTSVPLTGNGTTVTATLNAHGLYSGQIITVAFSSNSAFDIYRVPVTVTTANQFTYPKSGASGSTTALWVRRDNDQIKMHDYASSGWWITNLGNYFEDNYASDCVAGDRNNSDLLGGGVWISLASECFGHSANVNINPRTTDTLLLKGFTCHSNYSYGMRFSEPVTDELGNVAQPAKYAQPFLSTDHVFWKNAQGGYFNQVALPDYRRWTTADNGQTDFVGSTNNGATSRHHLLIGTSLNNLHPATAGVGSAYPVVGNLYPRSGFASYHGTVRFFDLTAVNFPYAGFIYDGARDKGFSGGVMQGMTDIYDAPGIDLTQGLNTGIKLINSHYGEMCPPIHLDGRTVTSSGANRHYSLPGAFQDTDGKYGTAGYFQIPYSRAAVALGSSTGGAITAVDDYFLTGAANVADGPTSGTVVCKTTSTRFFGSGWADSSTIESNTNVAQFVDGSSRYPMLSPVTCTRQVVATGATIGTPWLIKRGDTSNAFSGYHSFTMQAGGRFQIVFADDTLTIAPPTTYLYFPLMNANTVGDFIILGLPWSGSVVPRICFGSSFSNESGSVYRGGSSLNGSYSFNTFASDADVVAKRAVKATIAGSSVADVVADTAGTTYYRDTSNNRVWVRYTLPAGGVTYTTNPDPIGSSFAAIYDLQWVIVKA
jgi:hypothetical protein